MKNVVSEKKKIRVHKSYLVIKRGVFFCFLGIFAVIGLLIPLRPKTSEVEKRELTKFPKFTLASFMDGQFLNDVSTWYADTFPFRETLISADTAFKEAYGIKDEQIIRKGGQSADDIPDAGATTPPAAGEDHTNPDNTDAAAPGETTETTETAKTGETTETALPETQAETEPLPDGTIHVIPEASGDVYVTGDTAFGLYYFSLDGANAYVNMIDKAQKKLSGVADVYDILIPTAVGVNLDDNAQEKIGSSNQQDAINYILSSINNINSNVKTVNVFDTLRAHNSEYLYFRTDHHWTALGAYYAYTDFCKAKGITPNALDSYETVEYPNFVGSHYASSGQVASLKNNPDTVIAYIPKGTNNMVFWDNKLTRYDWNIIYDVTDYPTGVKYSTFAGADQPFAYIDNPAITDGSACIVIKESFGNAFVPFLVDHYQHVYIVDYRYFNLYPDYGNSVYKLATEKNVKDVIFVNNASAMTNPDQISQMSAMFN